MSLALVLIIKIYGKKYDQNIVLSTLIVDFFIQIDIERFTINVKGIIHTVLNI